MGLAPYGRPRHAFEPFELTDRGYCVNLSRLSSDSEFEQQREIDAAGSPGWKRGSDRAIWQRTLTIRSWAVEVSTFPWGRERWILLRVGKPNWKPSCFTWSVRSLGKRSAGA